MKSPEIHYPLLRRFGLAFIGRLLIISFNFFGFVTCSYAGDEDYLLLTMKLRRGDMEYVGAKMHYKPDSQSVLFVNFEADIRLNYAEIGAWQADDILREAFSFATNVYPAVKSTSKSVAVLDAVPLVLSLEMRESSLNKKVEVREFFLDQESAYRKHASLFRAFGIELYEHTFVMISLEERVKLKTKSK